jgi:predicted MPP superfamily phosphohydrolase
MIIFLLTFFSLYGGLHVYFYFKAVEAFHPDLGLRIILTVFLIFVLMAPIMVRLTERAGLEGAACLLSWIGYLWLGFLFIFFVSSLLIDIWNIIIPSATGMMRLAVSVPRIMPVHAFFCPLIVSLAINTYGFFEAKNIQTELLTIETSKLSRDMAPIRIVQISDVHIGMIVQGERLEHIMEAVRKARPDVLIASGDLVDGQIDSLNGAVDILKTVNPPLGKFAITGNHEFYAGLPKSLAFMRSAGFTVLQGSYAIVAGKLFISGVDDPTGERLGLSPRESVRELLLRQPMNSFKILLKHQPTVDQDTIGLFDLQLSGHTHRGQIFPFSLITKLFFYYHTGTFRLPDSSILHVSRGTGTWGPPVRFLAPPEITLITLKPLS